MDTKRLEIIYEKFSTISRYVHHLQPSTLTTALWKKVLNLTHIPHLNSNFFEEGGDSIQAVELLAKLHQKTQIEINLPEFLCNPTLEYLNQKYSEKITFAPNETNSTRHSQKRDIILSATQNQRWLWLNKAIDGHSWHYNLPFVFEIQGAFELDALEKALQKILSEYPALRTIFFENKNADELYQKILQKSTLNLELIETVDQDEAFIRKLIHQKSTQEFEFSNMPPYQITLLKQAKNRYLLIINVHHIIFDAESFKIFIAQLSNFYNEFLMERATRIPEPILPPEVFSANQDISLSKLNEWKQQLENLPALKLPYDYSRPLQNNHEGGYIDFIINKAQSQKLAILAKKHKTSLQALMLVAVWALLRSYGNIDFCIPISISGRSNRTQTDIGFFSNVLPVRLPPCESLRNLNALLALYQKAISAAYQFADIPFYKLVNELKIERNGTHHLFNQFLLSVFDEKYTAPPAFKNTKTKFYQYGYPAARMDLTIEVMPNASGHLRIGIFYAAHLFTLKSVQELISRLHKILVQLMQGKMDLNQNITMPATIIGPYQALKKHSLYEHFEIQVQETPNRIALQHKNSRLTYQELSEKVQQFSESIMENGKGSIQCEVPVSPCDSAVFFC